MMIFLIQAINAYVIQEIFSKRFIVDLGPQQNLKTTADILKATNFALVPSRINSEFLIQNKNTKLVWEDPESARNGIIYSNAAKGTPNQKWSFVFNDTGSFNIVHSNKRMIYDPNNDNFRMKPPTFGNKDKTGYVIIDNDDAYWGQFMTRPTKVATPGEPGGPPAGPNGDPPGKPPAGPPDGPDNLPVPKL